MGKIQHTERKWAVNELTYNTHQIQILTPTGAMSMPMYSGQTQDELNQYARFIVTCCNNHHALLDACKAALDFMTALDIQRNVISGLSLQLNEAIAQAEKEE